MTKYMSIFLVCKLSQSLEDEMEDMSEKTLLHMMKQLRETISNIGSALNLRRNLCSLPVEIITRIVEEVPSASTPYPPPGSPLETFWNPDFRDSSALISLSMTCRRLRNITLSRTNWWRHMTLLDDKTSFRQLLSKSGEELLEVIIPGSSSKTSNLRASYDVVAPRMSGLHFLHANYAQLKSFNAILELPHPVLQSLTCCVTDPENQVWHRRRLGLSAGQFPRLRHLVLHGVVFHVGRRPLPETLTHLVLSEISSIPNLHERIAKLLCACPNLENIVISKVIDGEFPSHPPQPLLPRLRRVLLRNLGQRSLLFYLTMTSLCGSEVALQIINDSIRFGYFSFEPVLSERMQERATMLTVGSCLMPYPTDNESPLVSITVTSPVSALRIASTPTLVNMSHSLSPGIWAERILSDTAALADVQEAWIVRGASLRPFPFFGQSLAPILAALPALQTVRLVTLDYPAQRGELLEPPTLQSLPSALGANPPFNSPHLKTLYVVYCDSPGRTSDSAPPADASRAEKRTLSFSPMLAELASSAYCYLERLIVQVTPVFEVRDKDVVRLLEYFLIVEVHEIDGPPRMPLPQCCTEDVDGAGGSWAWTRTMC